MWCEPRLRAWIWNQRRCVNLFLPLLGLSGYIALVSWGDLSKKCHIGSSDIFRLNGDTKSSPPVMVSFGLVLMFRWKPFRRAAGVRCLLMFGAWLYCRRRRFLMCGCCRKSQKPRKSQPSFLITSATPLGADRKVISYSTESIDNDSDRRLCGDYHGV